MTYFWIGLGIYAIGFILMLILEANIGPVTLSLALLRATVWPIYIVTGWPQGVAGGY